MELSTHGKSARRITAAEAAGLVKSGDWVTTAPRFLNPMYSTTPWPLAWRNCGT